MPGLKIVVGPNGSSLPPAPEPPAAEIRLRSLPVYSAQGIDARFDVPEDYPSFTHEEDDFLLFVEGLVYDRSDEELVKLARELKERGAQARSLEEAARGFVLGADGEYVVLFVDKASGTAAVFNDRWGRLPLYAARTPSQWVLSREPIGILPHLPAIRFDRRTIVEWMAFEYTLNDRWFVEGVERVAPATLYLAAAGPGGVRVEARALERRDLTAGEPAGDEEPAARRYVDLYLEGYTARALRLTGLGYRLTSDLSGGFDTRFVLAGARRLGLPMEFYTDDLVTGDESEVALALAAACGCSATRVARPEFVRDAAQWRAWTYFTGGRVNAPTMMQALLVTRARKALVTGKAARFMGFAGELIRHPPLPAGGYGGFAGALAGDVYSRYIGFRDGAGLVGLEWKDYRRHLADTVSGWPEGDFANRCRRLYLLAYLGIGNAGEDRHRWHFWTVAPMWSNRALDFIYRSVGPEMTNVAFFTELMRRVHPEVLEVPIHRKPMDLTSRSGMRRLSAAGERRVRLRQHRLVRWLRRTLRDPEKWAARPSAEEAAWIREQLEAAFRESAAVRATFDEGAARRYLETQHAAHRLHQLLTAVWFVAEVDRRFPEACRQGAAS